MYTTRARSPRAAAVGHGEVLLKVMADAENRAVSMRAHAAGQHGAEREVGDARIDLPQPALVPALA